MPTCQSCGEKWSWFGTMKKIIKCSKRMNCNHCGEVQYQSKNSLNKMTFYSLSPLLIIFFDAVFNLPLTYTLVFAIPFVFLILFTLPFFLKLTNKVEPLIKALI